MAAMVQLTKKRGAIDPPHPAAPKPVWINAWGVNSVEASDNGGCWVRMDDGTGYLVAEDAEYVVLAIDEAHTEKEPNA